MVFILIYSLVLGNRNIVPSIKETRGIERSLNGCQLECFILKIIFKLKNSVAIELSTYKVTMVEVIGSQTFSSRSTCQQRKYMVYYYLKEAYYTLVSNQTTLLFYKVNPILQPCNNILVIFKKINFYVLLSQCP